MTNIVLSGRGLRGESQADILRRTGQYGVLPTDTDAEAMAKLNAEIASATATVAAVVATNGLGQQRRNLYDPATATSGYYLDATGALAVNAAYTTSAAIIVSTANTYRFKKAVSQVAWRNAGGTLIGAVTAVTADTEVTPPTGAATMRFSQTISTAIKPRQMFCPTSVSIAAWKYIAPFVEDTAAAKRNSLASAVHVGRSYQQQGIQIFDAAACVDGFALDQANGAPTASGLYSLSAFIAIDPETLPSQSVNNIVGVYAEDRSYLGFMAPGSSGTFDPITSYPDACWIKVQTLTANKATYKLGYGSTPASATFGYTSQATVDLTALQKARAATAAVRADDANVLNPTGVLNNRNVDKTTGGVSGVIGWSVTGRFEVNPGDYFSVDTAGGSNSIAFYGYDGAFISSAWAATQTATGSITGHVMTVATPPANGILAGQPVSGTGVTAGTYIVLKLTATTWLVSASQTVASTTLTFGVNFGSARWIEVPSAAYYGQYQANTLTGLQTSTIKQGRAVNVNKASFTATITGTVLDVTTPTTSPIYVGLRVIGDGVTPCIITGLGTGTGSTGTYTVSVSQTVTSRTMYAGSNPAVTPRVFGGGGASVGQNWSGIAAYLQGDSQVNNGLFQGTMASVSGLVITSQGTPGRDVATGATAMNAVDLSPYSLVINDHGTNDFGGNKTLGTIADDKTVASFYGAMAKWVDEVRAKSKSIRIVFFGPTPRTDTITNGLGLTLKDYNDAMRIFCAKWSIPFCDLYSTVGFDTLNYVSGTSPFTSDGLHYNTTGAAIVGRIKGNFINTSV